ncbi:MAG: hypothetical protein ACYTGN_09950 [Planctomycetota bacterium]
MLEVAFQVALEQPPRARPRRAAVGPSRSGACTQGKRIPYTGAMIGASASEILHSIPWYAWVAIVAIVGGTISSVVKARYRHALRMEMVAKGLDPTAINSKLDED